MAAFKFGKNRFATPTKVECPCTRSFRVPDGVDWNEQSRALAQAAYYVILGLIKPEQFAAIAAGETIRVTINRASEAGFVDVMYVDAVGNFFPVDGQEAGGLSLVVVELAGGNRPVVNGELKDRKIADATLEIYDQLVQLRLDWLNSEGIFAPGYVPPTTEQALPAPVPTNGQQAPANPAPAPASTAQHQQATNIAVVSEKLEDGSLRLTITIPGFKLKDSIAQYLGVIGYKTPTKDSIRDALERTGRHYVDGIVAECKEAIEAMKQQIRELETKLTEATAGCLDDMRRELSGAEKSLEIISKVATEIKAEDNREKKAVKAIMDCLGCDEEAAKRILKQQPPAPAPTPAPAAPAPAAPQTNPAPAPANPAPASPTPVPPVNPAPANPAPQPNSAPAPQAPNPTPQAPANPATIYSCDVLTELCIRGVPAKSVPAEVLEACKTCQNIRIDFLNYWLNAHDVIGSDGQIVQL